MIFFLSLESFFIKFNDQMSICQAINNIINALKNKKIEKKVMNFLKSLGCSLIKFNDLEAFVQQLTLLLTL